MSIRADRQYSEGYSIVTQWHLIGTSKKTAYELIHACSNWASSIHDAVLVFDQSYWQVDYKLYEAIQKVRHPRCHHSERSTERQASWDDVVLEEKFKKSIQNDYRSFFKSEETYKRLQVPWKRGLIFMGVRSSSSGMRWTALGPRAACADCDSHLEMARRSV